MMNRLHKSQGVLFKVIDNHYVFIVAITKEFTNDLSFKEMHRELKSASKIKLRKVANFFGISENQKIQELRFYINYEMGEKCWNFPMNDKEPYHIKIYNLYYKVLKLLEVKKISIVI